MTTDDLISTGLVGVLAALVAFEFVVAFVMLLTARSVGRPTASPDLWQSRPNAIRRHLAVRRHEFNVVRWQYQVLRSPEHGHQIRNAIRRLGRPGYAPRVQPATRPLFPGA